MTIPTYREASDRRCEGQATAMDHFITQWQPTPPEADDFRADLQAAIREVEGRRNTNRMVIGLFFILCLVGMML